MPGAEGNDHVRLLDSQGNTQRTDSVLSPEAIEDADRVGADELSGLGLALRSTDTVTGVEVDRVGAPSLPASGSDDFSSTTDSFEVYTFNTSFDTPPSVITQWVTPHAGVSINVSATAQDEFEVRYTNSTSVNFTSSALEIVYMAVGTE